MRTYIPKGERNSKERYSCGCGNQVFSTLPKSEQEETEVIECPTCRTPILFSTIALPKKIGYPVSRRKWSDVKTELVWKGDVIPAQMF